MNEFKNTYNPLVHMSDPAALAERIASLMPKAEPMSEEAMAKFEQERRAGEARYNEARYGALPEGCYRILDQGGFVGWHYELEIDGQEVVLREEGKPYSEYAVHGDKALTEKLARVEIARRHGQDAADKATFKVVWGGEL